MQEKGFTLIELVVSITIITVLSTIATVAYTRWIKKVSIENDTKKIFALLQEARARAFAEKRICGLIFSGRNVRLVCDTDMDDSITDEQGSINSIRLKNDVIKKLSYGSSYPRFDRDGTANILGTIYVSDISTNPAYSCVRISRTRIKMGKWNGGECNVK